ncbi:MAG: hypothetical protein IPI46_01955 [Bacteroidetes bacterium]|nr:hypothetical protein [Bacteroidota bacterium]
MIQTINEPKQVKMVSSINGNILAYVTSGTNFPLPLKQELFLLKPNGEVIKTIQLSDTIFQHIHAMKGVDGGFFVSASSNNLPFIANYKINDNGQIAWSQINLLSSSNYNINAPAVCLSFDQQYMVMYQQYGSGYYIQKISTSGSEITKTKLPSPAANHYGTGLNYGEKYSQFFQANDSLIIIQGITYDLYDQLIDNCFIRALDNNLSKKWYSTNFDSTHIENSSGLYSSYQNKILLFGCKTSNSIFEGFGDVFIRTYSLSGILENEKILPRIDGTPTLIKNILKTPDGGFILVGSNNQLSANDVVSPNKIALIKLNEDLQLSWSKTLETSDPAKGFDLTYLPDGSMALIGLLKDKLTTNKLLYLHLDPNGNIINN